MARHKQTTALVLTGAISIVIGFVPGYLTGLKYGLNVARGHAPELSSPQPLPANPSNPTLALNAEEMIRELNCVCGCKMDLASCTCDERRGSKEIKALVQAFVQNGFSRPEIIKGLIERYGEAILIKKT